VISEIKLFSGISLLLCVSFAFLICSLIFGRGKNDGAFLFFSPLFFFFFSVLQFHLALRFSWEKLEKSA